MSLTVGLTALFGAGAGAGAGFFVKFCDALGGGSESLPGFKTTILATTLIGGGLGWGSAHYLGEEQADLNNISKAQAQQIVDCHNKLPEGFEVKSGLNGDGSVICNYIKPN